MWPSLGFMYLLLNLEFPTPLSLTLPTLKLWLGEVEVGAQEATRPFYQKQVLEGVKVGAQVAACPLYLLKFVKDLDVGAVPLYLGLPLDDGEAVGHSLYLEHSCYAGH